MKWLAMISMLGGFLLLTGTGSPQAMRISQHLSISGATSLVPLTKRFLPEWERKHPGITVSVTAGGSWAGILTVSAGQADIGMADLEPPMGLRERLDAYPAGRLAVVFIANPADGVSRISRSELDLLLQGRIRNWQRLNGKDAPVIIISRPRSSGARAMIDRLLPHPGLTPDAIIQLSNGAVLKTVRETPGAMGYVEWRPGMGGVTMLAIGQQSFDAKQLAVWPYFTEPTFYVRKGASPVVHDLARGLSRSSARADFGIYDGGGR